MTLYEESVKSERLSECKTQGIEVNKVFQAILGYLGLSEWKRCRWFTCVCSNFSPFLGAFCTRQRLAFGVASEPH